MKARPAILLLGCCCLLAGCADFQRPNIKERLTHPIRSQITLRVGLSQDEISAMWGEPAERVARGTDAFSTLREEWIYTGKLISGVTLGIEPLTGERHLYFVGGSLVGWDAGSTGSPGPIPDWAKP